jgi:hypothetical protein
VTVLERCVCKASQQRGLEFVACKANEGICRGLAYLRAGPSLFRYRHGARVAAVAHLCYSKHKHMLRARTARFMMSAAERERNIVIVGTS